MQTNSIVFDIMVFNPFTENEHENTEHIRTDSHTRRRNKKKHCKSDSCSYLVVLCYIQHRTYTTFCVNHINYPLFHSRFACFRFLFYLNLRSRLLLLLLRMHYYRVCILVFPNFV